MIFFFLEFSNFFSFPFPDRRLQAGSLGAVRDFFGDESVPTRLLRRACESLEMTVDMPSADATSPPTFLGKGGSGTVYSLRNKHGDRVAVKLCNGVDESFELTNEVSSFQAAVLRFDLKSFHPRHVEFHLCFFLATFRSLICSFSFTFR